MSLITVETMNDVSTVTVEIEETNVVVDAAEFNVITEGIQGPAGPAGEAVIAGYYTEAITPLQSGDLLSFSGTKWVNVRRTEVSDGGNF